MDWSIQEVAKLAGTTSRTLRHYAQIGLLAPSRVGANGYRRYDQAALVRLQRILLLRELGLGLAQIAEVLAAGQSEEEALTRHLAWMREEQVGLAKRIAAVEATVAALREGVPLMAENMFDGFDHTAHRREVTERWGEEAYARSDAWWRGMDAGAKAEFTRHAAQLAGDWVALAEAGGDPGSPEAQAQAARHVRWLAGIPGTPSVDVGPYVRGLGDMYVADPRFSENYATATGGTAGAQFVRDALHHYADEHL
ncbi:MerR family transcriptional regulator [Microbacterium sp. P04]|uniref:MerR family transcriptional regulator n=1 Tax=Microbacterium sp. P04 TaxID=3366947 RepID=UPI0037466536